MESNITILEGTVEEVVYHSPSNDYVVLDLATADELVTVVGDLGEIRDGEKLVVHGKYINHIKFGLQFKAEYCERTLPTTAEDIEKYIASGIVNGIGASIANRIVTTFGDRTFEIIEEHPERLSQIKGISKAKAVSLSKEFRKLTHIRKLYECLAPYHVSASIAMKAFKKWELDSISKIQKNPYLLCYEGINLPFDTADTIAKSFNFPNNCYERISAGFYDILNESVVSGHTCLEENEFIYLSQKKLGVKLEDLESGYVRASKERSIIIWECPQDSNKYVYLKTYYDAEVFIAKKVLAMTERDPNKFKPHPEMITALEKHTGTFYNQRQKDAINMVVNSNLVVLTGGPGTGKTTTLKGIITILESQGLNVKVTAPTGRATKRITEITDHDAVTIHRLLEVNFDGDGNATFSHNAQNPLNCDAVIVDEMSMVDVLLFESLLKALSNKCKLILVGDSDQLPSVNAGNVLKDLIASDRLNVITLDEIFRQAQQSAIVMNAHNVINGKYPNIYLKDNDFFFLQRLDYKSTQDTIIDLWLNRLPKAYNYSPTDNIQVLCPSKKGTLGTVALNQAMQQAINPNTSKRPELKNGQYTLRKNDKVMQIKNNYDVVWEKDGETGTGIYNGDIGTITAVSHYGLTVDFDGCIVDYKKDMLDQLELAYAITIHKSQGSEFDVVVMPMLNNFRQLSYRNLLYTGITRAKKLLVVVGSRNELFAMVDNDRQTLRCSNLNYMVQEAFGGETLAS